MLQYMRANEPSFAGVNVVNGGAFSSSRLL
jgi:hypothetical protein